MVGSDSDEDLTQDDERSFQANLSLAAQTAHMPITKDTPSRRSSVLEGDEITRRFPDPGKFPSQNLINNYEPQNGWKIASSLIVKIVKNQNLLIFLSHFYGGISIFICVLFP